MSWNASVALVGMWFGTSATALAEPIDFALNPQATYLIHPDAAAPPLVIELAAVGIDPDTIILLRVHGSFQCNVPFNPGCVSTSTSAIFSSDGVVLSQNERFRVTGSIGAGLDFISGPNCDPNGVSETDIPDDFAVNPFVAVRVPAAAQYLIVGSPDCWNSDNIDSDGDYGLSIVDVSPTCLADATGNGDGLVNFADLSAVLGNWLSDYSPGTGPGDANGDGLVDFGDITAVLGNWLAVCP